jgi:hypothetical protein
MFFSFDHFSVGDKFYFMALENIADTQLQSLVVISTCCPFDHCSI